MLPCPTSKYKVFAAHSIGRGGQSDCTINTVYLREPLLSTLRTGPPLNDVANVGANAPKPQAPPYLWTVYHSRPRDHASICRADFSPVGVIKLERWRRISREGVDTMGSAVDFDRIYYDHGRAREDIFAAARSSARSRPGRVSAGLIVRRRLPHGMGICFRLKAVRRSQLRYLG